MLVTARDFGYSLPLDPNPWWEILIGEKQSHLIAEAANSLVGFAIEGQTNDKPSEFEVASLGFVKSLLPGGSFNDPGSFLWEEFEQYRPKSN